MGNTREWTLLAEDGLKSSHRTHQEAGGVVQEAAEATHEAPLQEGRVLWGKLFGVVGE